MATVKELRKALIACQRAMATGRPHSTKCALWDEAVEATDKILGPIDFDDAYEAMVDAEERQHSLELNSQST